MTDNNKNLVTLLLDSDNGVFEVENKTIEIKRLSQKLKAPFNLTIKNIPARKYSDLQQRAVKFDKKGLKEANIYQLQASTVLEGVVDPDFHNSDICQKFNVATPLEALEKIFTAGEIAYISDEISKLSGYDKTEEETVNEVKN